MLVKGELSLQLYGKLKIFPLHKKNRHPLYIIRIYCFLFVLCDTHLSNWGLDVTGKLEYLHLLVECDGDGQFPLCFDNL